MQTGRAVDVSIARYLNVRQATFPSFASDGTRLSFITDITGVPQVWQVALSDSGHALWPDQLTFASDRVMAAEFSPAAGDGRLLYAADAGGNENAQLYLLSADGAYETSLTAGYEDAMHMAAVWSDDGTQILFAANRRHPGLFDLYLQSLDDDARLVWLNEQPGYLTNLAFSPDGQRATATRACSSFHHELFEIDLSSGVVRWLRPADRGVRYFGCRYASDGRSLYLSTDAGSDYLYLGRLDLANGTLESLTAPNWDVETVALSPDAETLAYSVNVDGTHRVCALDVATGQERESPGLTATPGIIADGRICFSADSTYLAFSYTSAARTADVFVWDLTRDQVRAVTQSSHGGIPPTSFVAPELVSYPTFDAEERGGTRHIPAWFYRPTGDRPKPFPAVVLVHGGPEGQYRPSFHFFVQYLLYSGYAVLAPNVRGSTGYGKAYSHLDDVEKRMDSVADLAQAAYWLRARPEVDDKRVAVYGGSYGGFMVLAALTAYPDLWAAGVDLVGISNLATFLENTSAYRRAHREAEYGSLERDRTFLESIAPIRYVHRIAAPLMVIHGANDPRVPLSEAQQLVDALQDRGVPVEFLVFDDEGHGVVKLHNKQVAYPAIVAFLDRHLAG